MKQLLLICCVAGVCWASEDDGYGSLPKAEQSNLLSMQSLKKSLPDPLSFGIKNEKRKFYFLKNGLETEVPKSQVYCQLKDQPKFLFTVEQIEQIGSALNDAYGKVGQVRELKEKYKHILPFVSAFCTVLGLTAFNENCLYSEVNCWTEFHEKINQLGESVIYLIKDSKDSPRVLSPHPMPKTPHEEEDQFFDFDMEISSE